MDMQKVDSYILANARMFSSEQLPVVREKLLSLDESKFPLVLAADLKDPTLALVFSLVLGNLGVDRFYIGDIGLGVLKLLTLGVCGIMTIVDYFLIIGKTRDKNFNAIMSIF